MGKIKFFIRMGKKWEMLPTKKQNRSRGQGWGLGVDGGDYGNEFRVQTKIRKLESASRMKTEPEACHSFF